MLKYKIGDKVLLNNPSEDIIKSGNWNKYIENKVPLTIEWAMHTEATYQYRVKEFTLLLKESEISLFKKRIVVIKR